MNAKEYLKSAALINMSIDCKLSVIASLRTAAEKCTSSISPGPGGGGDSRRLENIIAKIDAAEREVDADIDKLILKKAEIEATIGKLEDPLQREVLSMRYIGFMSWQDIVESTCYSESSVDRLHRNALKRLDEILEDDSSCH